MDLESARRGPSRDAAHSGIEPVDYLDAVSSTAFAQEYKTLTYRAMGAAPGAELLDVGCGTGDDVIAMAQLCHPGGSAVGIDLNARMVGEAWKRLGARRLPASFRVCDGHHLDFESHTFDGVRCDRVLQHMEDPRAVLAEMIRVTRPDGRVVAVEPDWDTFTIDCQARKTVRKIADYMAERSVRHGWIGRQLYRLLRELGLQEVRVRPLTFVLTDLASADTLWGLSRHAREAVAEGWLTAEEAAGWQQELLSAAGADVFFSAAVGYLAWGITPRSAR